MSEILKFYKENASSANRKNATDYLLKDTLSSPLTGSKKIKELDGMDMESKSSGRIIPSMIYTFIYDGNKDLQEQDNVIFGDNMPIVLCCEIKQFERVIKGKNVKGMYLIGINLNFLTGEERAVVLDAICSNYSNFYDNIYKDVYNNKLAINKGLQNVVMGNKFINSIKAMTGIDVSKCVRSYNISFAKNIRLIEYNLWKFIPLYDATRTVSGISLKNLQKIMTSK